MTETNVTAGEEASDTTPTRVVKRPSSRAARTRQAVVDALLALLTEGNLRPTAREVADRADVSLRSVYVHFDDVEALFLAAALRHREQLMEVLGDMVATGGFEERLTAFVERRARGYEEGANIRRAAELQEPFSPALHEILNVARRLLVDQIEEIFAPELAPLDSQRGARQRAASLVACGAAAWDDLRRRQGLTPEEAQSVMYYMLDTILRDT